ncbi:MAG: hypothetical protein MJ010_06745 [Paludibacteraceae bacterium]|nr:hypothetical protein [Paludibacteraceae bacterium]
MPKQYPIKDNNAQQVNEPSVAYATQSVASSMISACQMQILDSIANVNSDQELIEIRNLIAEYFSNKALNAVDELCDAGKLSTQKIESWSKEHLRTPYK